MFVLTRADIERLIDLPRIADAIFDAYCATSTGRVNLPPVGHITFPEREADCHIKYGHVLGSDVFVIKVATGFPSNVTLGLDSGNGITLVMSAVTGAVQAVMHDEMLMTDIRTGLGGAIATRALARKDSQRVVVMGTGVQACKQVEAHTALLGPEWTFEIWGRSNERADGVVAQMQDSFGDEDDVYRGAVMRVDDLELSLSRADVIVTVTGSTEPLFPHQWIKPGTHITAVGADAPGKQELDIELVEKADVLVADLVSQCVDHGELSHAVGHSRVETSSIRELGDVLLNPEKGRTSDQQITVADLTGVAAQDIAIAQAVLGAHALELKTTTV